MGLINPTLPTIGDPNSSEDADIRNALQTIVSAINGNITDANVGAGAAVAYSKLNLAAGLQVTDLASSLAAILGVTATYREYSEVLTTETSASLSWADLATVGPQMTLTVTAGSLLLLQYDVTMRTAFANATAAWAGVEIATDYPLTGTISSFTSLDVSGITFQKFGNVKSTTSQRFISTLFSVPIITSGSRTIKLKYGVDGGANTGEWSNRKLWAISITGF